jgi:hypothetical protein
MRIFGILAIGVLLLGCGSGGESAVTSTLEPNAIALAPTGSAGSAPGSATVETSTTQTTEAPGQNSEFCATGTYVLDGPQFWRNAAAASTDPGSGEVISGRVVLQLGQDFYGGVADGKLDSAFDVPR